MSILNLLTNRSKVNAAAKKVARARKREGDVAEQLFQEAFQGFQTVVNSDPVIADALYHWGFALFHYAQTKSGDAADKIYQDANNKFSFCMTMNPHHLGAAIDWGASLMEQARNRGADTQANLYDSARERFLAANAIQAGSASYNLACIHALRGEEEACRAALQDAREHGSLPAIGAMLNDADLALVQQHEWFVEFMRSVEEEAAAAANAKQPKSEETSPAEGSESASETAEEAESQDESRSRE